MERGQPVKKRIPVILDTDIGNDIDDTWALVFALLRDELDIRLVTTVLGDPIYSAKLVAKLTGVCEKAPIDIGLGKRGSEPARYQGKWVADYDLASYRGRIYEDGVARMLEVIRDCGKTVTILGMGPCTNLAEALRRDPHIAEKVRVISIFGGLFRGYFGSAPCPEYNVHQDIEAAKAVLAGYPHLLISPIDTFFDVVLDGERLERIRRMRDRSAPVRAVLENFDIWADSYPLWRDKPRDRTSELCDVLPVYLAITNEGLINRTYRLEIAEKGLTRVSDAGVPVEVAIEWSDRDRVLDFLTDTLCEG